MRPMIRAAAFALAAVLLAACSGEAVRYYTLLRPSATPIVAGQAAFALDVQPVRVPATVNVPELVLRQSGGEVAVVETRMWAAPLPDEVRGALAAELTDRLGVPDVSMVSPPPGLPVYRVLVDLQRFDARLGSGVRIDAVWTVLDTAAGVKARRTCVSSVTTPVAPGYDALIGGAQDGLARLAADIATLVGSLRQAGDAARCPG
ncbi:PqiC family protein [Solimonas soli]|uniref:PqiC family protein n=1 Tax=Solimonas soli TaxID=413479 RepID=UPI0004B1FA57|nr:PqiC family protein [Solimonas soli]